MLSGEVNMEELIALVANKTGLPPEAAKLATETVLQFLKAKLPQPLAAQIDGLLAGSAVTSALGGASGLAQNSMQLFVSRVGVGLGEATCAPAGQSLIGDLFPPQQRARAMSIFMLGLPAGLFLAYLSAGAIGAAFGWRAAFLVACIPGLLFAWLAMRIPEPMRGAADAARTPGSSAAGLESPFRAVLKLPTMWWIILSGIFHNFNMYAINAFQTPFLQRFHEMGLRQASNVSAVSLGAVGAIGLLAGGWLSDKISAKRRDGRLLLPACSMAIAAPSIFLALNQPKGSVTAFMLLMAIGTMTMFVYYATVYAAIQDIIEPLRSKLLWGFDLPYMLTGFLNEHPRAAIKFKEAPTKGDIIEFYNQIWE